MTTWKIIYHGKNWQYFLIACLACCCYINTIFGAFVFDDTEAIVKNKDVISSTPLKDVFKNDFWGTDITSNLSHKSYRPFVILTYRINAYFAGSELNPLHFHITNIVLYVILCLMVIPVCEQLFYINKNDNCAFLSSLLFTTHPIHTEVVASVVGRADLLASTFFLFSILLYAQHRRRNFVYLLGVVIIIFIGTLCKETAITALGVCFMYDCTNSNTKRRSFVKRSLLLFLSGLMILFVRLKLMNFEGPTFTMADNPAAFSTSIFTRIFTHNYIYILNILLLIWPQWLCFDWSMGCVPLITNFYDCRIAPVIFFWIFIMYESYILLKEVFKKFRCNNSLLLATSLILFPFLPATNIFFKVGFVIAERILLLPSLGYTFFIVHGLKKWGKAFNPRKNLDIILYGICLIYVFRTIQRNRDWQTEQNLFNSALEICPLNAKVHYNVGKVAADNSKKDVAIIEYRKAIELNPQYEQAMNNLANLLREEKQVMQAEILLRKALTIRPNFAAAWMNLGIVLTNLNRSDEAEQCYLKAITYRTKYPDCYYNLGNLYLDAKRYEDALDAWGKAVLFRPTHTAAWSNMLVLLDSLKKYEQVLTLGQNALMHNPTSPAIHFSIANSLGKVQQFEKAEKHFLEALNLSPNNPLYYSNLGVLYHRWRQPHKAIEMYRKSLQLDPKLKTAENNLRKLINTFDTMWKPRQIGSKTLTFEMIEEKKILKIEDMSGNEVYLGWESVSEVWSLESVLRYRLSYSSGSNFTHFYEDVIRAVAEMPGDVKINIYNIINRLSEKSDDVCCMLEVFLFMPEKALFDVQLKRRIQEQGQKRVKNQ
ncbi:hypothetical protein FQA39_LY06795 [Lamprigera yunnana]|nr:hypothetical protein FQA39_LY06795 [Lamprigera yunnana]